MGFRFKKENNEEFRTHLTEELTRWALFTHKSINSHELAAKISAKRFDTEDRALLLKIEKAIYRYESSLSLVQGNLDLSAARDLVTLG